MAQLHSMHTSKVVHETFKHIIINYKFKGSELNGTSLSKSCFKIMVVDHIFASWDARLCG
jgi:hypothetical protein